MPTYLSSKIAVEETRIKQTEQVKSLLAKCGNTPKLVIIQIKDDPVINVYVNAKKRYGARIGVDVDILKIEQSEALTTIQKMNNDKSVHGIIVQLPIDDTSQTDEIVNAVAKSKDVDGLSKDSPFTPATPLAIMFILAHYKITFEDKNVAVVGRGSLVGAPIMKILDGMGVPYTNINSKTINPEEVMNGADILISATGIPSLVKSENIKSGAVVVDAGTATDSGKTVGDVADEAYERDDISITPKKGGVGPMTVCALFSNVLTAYESE